MQKRPPILSQSKFQSEFFLHFGEFILPQSAQPTQAFLTDGELLGRLEMLAVRRVQLRIDRELKKIARE